MSKNLKPENPRDKALANYLAELRNDAKLTQRELLERGAQKTGTRGGTIGTVRNAENDLRPVKLGSLRQIWKHGLDLSDEQWAQLLLLWALKKDAECLQGLNAERAELHPEAEPLKDDVMSQQEALVHLKASSSGSRAKEDMKDLVTAARKMPPAAIQLLTKVINEDWLTLHRQLELIAPLVVKEKA